MHKKFPFLFQNMFCHLKKYLILNDCIKSTKMFIDRPRFYIFILIYRIIIKICEHLFSISKYYLNTRIHFIIWKHNTTFANTSLAPKLERSKKVKVNNKRNLPISNWHKMIQVAPKPKIVKDFTYSKLHLFLIQTWKN